jgi:lysophospholipase L1-like esterase
VVQTAALPARGRVAFAGSAGYVRRMKQRFVNFAFALSMFLSVTASAENTAIIPVPRTTVPTNWMSTHEAFVKQAKQGNIDLLFLGDSITAGWFWGNCGINIWQKSYAPRRAANFGIGWDRTQNVLWRIENGELDGIKPRAVVLLIGTNNCGNEDDGKPRNSTPEIVAGVTAIVSELRSRMPESKILLFGIFPRGEKNDPIRDQVKAVNDQLAKLDDGKWVKFMDIGPLFLEPDGTLPRSLMPDLLHPNAKGYQIWSDAMEGTLAAMLK